ASAWIASVEMNGPRRVRGHSEASRRRAEVFLNLRPSHDDGAYGVRKAAGAGPPNAAVRRDCSRRMRYVKIHATPTTNRQSATTAQPILPSAYGRANLTKHHNCAKPGSGSRAPFWTNAQIG